MTCTTKLRTDHFVNIAQWESALVVDSQKNEHFINYFTIWKKTPKIPHLLDTHLTSMLNSIQFVAAKIPIVQCYLPWC